MSTINYYELIMKNPFNLEKVPKEFQTIEICTTAINKTWKIIHLITNFTPEICNLIVDKNGMHLQLIPPEFRSEELCWKALLSTKYTALPLVPNQTSDMCFGAINNLGISLHLIREPTMEMQILAIKQCVGNLEHVKDSPNRDELYKYAVSNNPKAFKYITNLTPEICTTAVNTDGTNLKYIPIEFQTLDLIKIACEKDNVFFQYVKHLTPEILNYIYEKCGLYSMCIINKELLTSEIILHSLELDIVENGIYDLLNVFPEELKTKENCLKAFEKNNFSIYSMPNEFKTLEMCMKAFDNFRDLEYFLPEFITYDICKSYVECYGPNITHIPDHFKTEEMYRIAVLSDFTDGRVLRAIPDEIKTPELYDLAIQNTSGRAIQYITNPTQEQINLALELSNNDSFLLNYLGIVLEVIPNDRLYTVIPPPTEEECPICYELENDGTEWCKMNSCKTVQHAFHVKCVENWWNSDGGIRKCPMCRTIAIENV